MSTYVYTFTDGKKEIEAEGYNLWNGAINAGLVIVRADKLGTNYLQSTPFDQRERSVWCTNGHGSYNLWNVKQRRKL